MSDFTASFLAELTASLTAQMLSGLSRKLRDGIVGSPEEQALARCMRLGLSALLATVRTDSKPRLLISPTSSASSSQFGFCVRSGRTGRILHL